MSTIAHLQEPKAFDLYKSGVPQNEIAKTIGVSPQTISAWKQKYDWVSRLERLSTSSRTSLDIIKRIIGDKLRMVEEVPVDQLPKGFEDGLFKLQLVAEKMDAQFDRLAFTIEIMEDFNAFLVQNYPEHAELFHELLPAFLNEQGSTYGR